MVERAVNTFRPISASYTQRRVTGVDWQFAVAGQLLKGAAGATPIPIAGLGDNPNLALHGGEVVIQFATGCKFTGNCVIEMTEMSRDADISTVAIAGSANGHLTEEWVVA
jgi:hypothetical protein